MTQWQRLEAATRKYNLLIHIEQYPGDKDYWISIARILKNGKELWKGGYYDTIVEGIKECLDHVESRNRNSPLRG